MSRLEATNQDRPANDGKSLVRKTYGGWRTLSDCIHKICGCPTLLAQREGGVVHSQAD